MLFSRLEISFLHVWRDLSHFAQGHLDPGLKAQPSHDTWSLGVVFVAIIAGDYPWKIANTTDHMYESFLHGNFAEYPWNEISEDLIFVGTVACVSDAISTFWQFFKRVFLDRCALNEFRGVLNPYTWRPAF